MNPDLMFDTRLVDRMMARGKLTPEQVDAYRKALPDAAANAANLDTALAERGAPAPKAEAPKKGGKHG